MLSQIARAPMSAIHSIQRTYHRRVTFPKICEDTMAMEPFATAQYQRDRASHAILRYMQKSFAWSEHYALHDLGAEAAKIVINKITEAPDTENG